MNFIKGIFEKWLQFPLDKELKITRFVLRGFIIYSLALTEYGYILLYKESYIPLFVLIFNSFVVLFNLFLITIKLSIKNQVFKILYCVSCSIFYGVGYLSAFLIEPTTNKDLAFNMHLTLGLIWIFFKALNIIKEYAEYTRSI